MPPTEVFISHSSLDRAFTDKLVTALTAQGVPAWYSPVNIQGAQDWQDEIGSALARCEWFLVVLSPNSTQRPFGSIWWVKNEVGYAMNEARLEGKIVPVLLQPCEKKNLSWLLPQIQHVDFQNDFHEGCRSLFKIWEMDYVPS